MYVVLPSTPGPHDTVQVQGSFWRLTWDEHCIGVQHWAHFIWSESVDQ